MFNYKANSKLDLILERMEQMEQKIDDLQKVKIQSDYIGFSVKRLVEELKKQNCLSENYDFLTEAEKRQVVEKFIDDFMMTD